jgi:hypothetical protein
MQLDSRIVPDHVNNFMLAGTAKEACQLLSATFASHDWPSANLAVYTPLTLKYGYPLKTLVWMNGSTISASSKDCGIYNSDGQLICSTGSTALVGASVDQGVVLPNRVWLPPGRYYAALACNNTTARSWGMSTVTAIEGRLAGLLQEASAFPLPKVMTPVQWASTGFPLICLEPDVFD